MKFSNKQKVVESSLEAVIIRADGTRENLGVIAYYHKNPFKRIYRNLSIKWAAYMRSFF